MNTRSSGDRFKRRTVAEIAAMRAQMESARASVDVENRVANLERRPPKHRFTIMVTSDANVLATGDGQVYFPIDTSLDGMKLIDAQAHVSTASSSGTPTIQLRRRRPSAADVDMLSTRITIDANERYSDTAAATQRVLNPSNCGVILGDDIGVDVDVAGTGTKGLKVTLVFTMVFVT